MIWIGNAIAFFGCVLMIGIGFIKKKEHILTAQCAQFGIQALGNLVLGAVSGCVSGLVGVVRILVFHRVRVTPWLKLGFIAIQALLTLWAGADTLIDWMPMFSMVAYTWFLDTDNAVLFKLVNMLGNFMWVIYDLRYLNYVGFTFDVLTIFSTAIGIYMILKERKNAKCSDDKPAR